MSKLREKIEFLIHDKEDEYQKLSGQAKDIEDKLKKIHQKQAELDRAMVELKVALKDNNN